VDSFRIRRATSSDVGRIVGLMLLLQKHVEKSNPSVWRITEEGKKLIRQKAKADLTDDNVLVLVAEAGDKVIGYVRGEVTNRSDHLPRIVAQISFMYVVKQFRRKGVGRRLVKELCTFFCLRRAEDLTVRYVVGNKEAEGFWRKLGFEPIITTGTTSPKELKSKLKTK